MMNLNASSSGLTGRNFRQNPSLVHQTPAVWRVYEVTLLPLSQRLAAHPPPIELMVASRSRPLTRTIPFG